MGFRLSPCLDSLAHIHAQAGAVQIARAASNWHGRNMDPRAKSRFGLLSYLTDTVRLTVRMLLPVECPGCGLLDVLLCAQCNASLAGSFGIKIPASSTVGMVSCPPILAVGGYEGALRGMVLAWKDGGRRDLTEIMATAIYAACLPVRQANPVDLVIPIPSTRAAIRRRGGLHTLHLAKAAGLALGVVVAPVLRRTSSSRDQAGLTRRERATNLRGSLSTRAHFRVPQNRILLVDDIVTTGATIHESARILALNGAQVMGAVALAATPAAPGRGDKYPSAQEVE